MFVLGHLGIGNVLAKPFMGRKKQSKLPWGWLLFGTLLPDLIDKPLYYAVSWITGLESGQIGLISGTRTFGHAALFAVALIAAGALKRSRVLAAVALGVSTHVFLDHLGDTLYSRFWGEAVLDTAVSAWHSPRIQGLLFPFLGANFPDQPQETVWQHGAMLARPHILAGEFIGGVILYREWRKRRKSGATSKQPVPAS